MNGALKAALEQHAAYCRKQFGRIEPEWFVFPRMRDEAAPGSQAAVGSLKKGWNSVCKAAGVSSRLRDFRHSFCTKLGEAGVPESAMLDMMGHVGAMLQRYSHIRAKARREAIEALENRISVGVPKDSPKVGIPADIDEIVNWLRLNGMGP